VFAATPNPTVLRQLALSYGVHPFAVPTSGDRDQILRAAIQTLIRERRVRRGATLIVVTGEPWGKPGTANAVEVRTV
jgi:pyruvate kinase